MQTIVLFNSKSKSVVESSLTLFVKQLHFTLTNKIAGFMPNRIHIDLPHLFSSVGQRPSTLLYSCIWIQICSFELKDVPKL